MISPERLDSMQQGWARLLGNYGITADAAYPVFDVLTAAYSAPERYYHNLNHIAEMFRVANRILAITDNPAPLHLAIWFHDAVYDSRAPDNEERSANLARDLLSQVGMPTSILERVMRMIRATALPPSMVPNVDHETSLLLDADLAILGASEERYWKYAAAVRREYEWVSDTEYRRARKRVLEGFLARDRIYRNDLLFQEGEAPARANLQAEIAALSAGE